MERLSGILAHISSLNSPYGIGSFGQEAYDFVDFLKSAKQSVWEILPLSETGYGDSPYSSCCSYSYNPYFISLDTLCENGLLTKDDLSGAKTDNARVDYGALYETRYALLWKAFNAFDRTDKAFVSFKETGKFYDYAMFHTIKRAENYRGFYDWDGVYKYRNETALARFAASHEWELDFWQWIQFEAEREWFSLKSYAEKMGVKILGDMPLYVAYDSVDVWTRPQFFKLNENLVPKKVAGVPPDYFSENGQLWGNPVYDYEEMKKDGFSWWKERFSEILKRYDYLRIDHFRGFDRYYEIDYGEPTARNGRWVDVPSDELFSALSSVLKPDVVVAEDLGVIDDGVRALLKKVGYPGMRILEFAFNGEEKNPYLPESLEENAVCYTGTHDNDTLLGYIKSAPKNDYENFLRGVLNSCKVLGITPKTDTPESISETVMELGAKSKANWFILPLQDAAFLSGEYRMNTPGIESGNWTMRFPKTVFTKKTAEYLAVLAEKYDRTTR